MKAVDDGVRCNGKLASGTQCKRVGWFLKDGKRACGMHLQQVHGYVTNQELDEQRSDRKVTV